MADDNQTIIIKKIKKGGGGHHGGAWKVAYADFVTAMMAFFLLLWLLSSTSEEQKKGIAEYFTPTIGLKDSMGIGFDGGVSANSKEGAGKDDSSPVNIVAGQPEEGPISNNDAESPVDGDEESQMFEDAKKEMMQAIESDPNLREFSENILMEQTPEGLKIELRDSDKYNIFKSGSTSLSKEGKKILQALTPLIRKLPNHLSISGHTDAIPYSGKNKKYSNWELSTDRALSARRFLEQNEMTKERVKKIVGYSSSQLALPDDPTSQVNRRIELILLRGSHMSLLPQAQAAPRSLLTVPNAKNTLEKRSEKIEKDKKRGEKVANPVSASVDSPLGDVSSGNVRENSEPAIEEHSKPHTAPEQSPEH